LQLRGRWECEERGSSGKVATRAGRQCEEGGSARYVAARRTWQRGGRCQRGEGRALTFFTLVPSSALPPCELGELARVSDGEGELESSEKVAARGRRELGKGGSAEEGGNSGDVTARRERQHEGGGSAKKGAAAQKGAAAKKGGSREEGGSARQVAAAKKEAAAKKGAAAKKEAARGRLQRRRRVAAAKKVTARRCVEFFYQLSQCKVKKLAGRHGQRRIREQPHPGTGIGHLKVGEQAPI